MNTQEVLRKFNLRQSSLPTCLFKIEYFKKLFSIVQGINKEAIDLVISDLKKYPDQTDDDFNKLKDFVANAYKVQAHVYGSKGEYQSSDSKVIFNDSTLPDNISRITIENTSFYKMSTNSEPQYRVVINLDFNKPSVINFTVNPSFATENNSYIEVSGARETWVNGAYDQVMNSIKENRTNRGWLHGKGSYDIVLWFIYLPLVFWNIYKFETIISRVLANTSNILLVAVYIYIIIAALYLLRMFFDYTRWVFPYQEIDGCSRRGSGKHRRVWVAILSSLVISQIVNFFPYLFKLLF